MSGETVFWSVVSILIGILGNRYFASRVRLSWGFKRRKVLDPIGVGYPSDVKISLDGEIIDNLIEWRFAIWNSGNRPISPSDFINVPQIIVHVPEGRVLKIEPLQFSREVVHCKTDIENDRIKFSEFNIIDNADYILVTFYSEMTDIKKEFSRENRPAVTANIARMPKGPRIAITPIVTGPRSGISITLMVFYMCALGVLVGSPAVIKLWYPEKLQTFSLLFGQYQEVPLLLSYAFILFGCFSVIIGTFLLLVSFAGLFQNIPRAVRLAIFEDRSFLRVLKNRAGEGA